MHHSRVLPKAISGCVSLASNFKIHGVEERLVLPGTLFSLEKKHMDMPFPTIKHYLLGAEVDKHILCRAEL